MSKREEDFFNEATKQTRDSYVFQSDGTCSDDDVRDIAISLAEFGYTYAVDKMKEYLLSSLKAELGYFATGDFVKGVMKFMEEL